jgi:hypothetical protein
MKFSNALKEHALENRQAYPPYAMVVFKYPTMPAERSFASYARQVHPFHPSEEVQVTLPPPARPYGFSDALRNIQWTGLADAEGQRRVRISWKTYGSASTM